MIRLRFALLAGCVPLLFACGGETDDAGSDQNPASSGDPTEEGPGGSDDTGSDDTGGDDTGGDDTGGDDTGGDDTSGDDTSGDDTGTGDGEPDPTDEGAGGMAAEPEPDAGEPGGPGDVPGTPGPSKPNPEPDPVVQPIDPFPATGSCEGRACGDPCDLTGGNKFLIAADPIPVAGYCDADGTCSSSFPVCEGDAGDCTNSCPVPRICQPCDDGTCATASVACAADGGCGDITWTCSSDVKPKPVDCVCAIPNVCQLCDDGSCASASTMCNPDGSCSVTDWVCPDAAQ